MEYILPLAVIGVAIFTVLALFPNLADTLVAGSVNGKRQSAVMQVEPLGKIANDERVRIQLADGSFLEVDDYPASFAASIETVGADGTTGQLALVLKQLAAQLREKGETDTANQLEKLANQVLNLSVLQKEVITPLNSYAEQGKKPPQSELNTLGENGLALQMACKMGSSSECISVRELAPYWEQLNGAPYSSYFKTIQGDQVIEGSKTNSIKYGATSEQLRQIENDLNSSYRNYENYLNTVGVGQRTLDIYREWAAVSKAPLIQNNPALKNFVDKTINQTLEVNQVLAGSLGQYTFLDGTEVDYVQNSLKRAGADLDNVAAQTHGQGENVCKAGGGVRLVNDRCPP